jgi:hypothetical protein
MAKDAWELLLSVRLQNIKTKQKLTAEIFVPQRRRVRLKYRPPGAPATAPVWFSKYSVTIAGELVEREAAGENALQALQLSIEGVRIRIPAGEEEDWQTKDGVPSWMVFPRSVPINWGYDFYKQIVGVIDKEEAKFGTKRRRR